MSGCLRSKTYTENPSKFQIIKPSSSTFFNIASLFKFQGVSEVVTSLSEARLPAAEPLTAAASLTLGGHRHVIGVTNAAYDMVVMRSRRNVVSLLGRLIVGLS